MRLLPGRGRGIVLGRSKPGTRSNAGRAGKAICGGLAPLESARYTKVYRTEGFAARGIRVVCLGVGGSSASSEVWYEPVAESRDAGSQSTGPSLLEQESWKDVLFT